MRVLLDACVWGGAKAQLAAAGHDVVWVGDWNDDPGDDTILARAHAEGRVLVTLDKDFGELAVVRGVPHSGIIRIVGISARRQGEVCLRVLERYGNELAQGVPDCPTARRRLAQPCPTRLHHARRYPHPAFPPARHRTRRGQRQTTKA